MAYKNLFSNLSVAELARDHPINYFDIGILKRFKYLDIKFHIISNFNSNIISLMFKKSIF